MAVSQQRFKVEITGTLEGFSKDHALAKIAAYIRSLSGEQPLPFSTQSDFVGIRVSITEEVPR
jgi:hypothetical protein